MKGHGRAGRVCRSREDCPPEARSPSAVSPCDVGEPFRWTVAAYRLLQTDSTYGHDLERRHPRPHRRRRPSRSFVSPAFARRPVSGEARHAQASRSILQTTAKSPAAGEASHVEPTGSTGRSEGLARCVSSPPRIPAGHLVSSTRCRERLGVSSAAPRGMAPFERPCSLAHELTRGPSFRRPPAKENAFRKTEVPSTAQSSFRVQRDRSRCPLGLGLLVTPPCLDVVAHARQISLFQSGLATRSTSAFVSTRARLGPDRPSGSRMARGFATSELSLFVSGTRRSALAVSTIQPLAV